MSEYENMLAADIIAEALIDWKVDTIFGLPGDGINGFMEALRTRQDKIKFILVRHEESAAFMACAYSKYTGKLGACVATSGPGAIHLLNGLYDAKADNTPVIAITGSTYSDMIGSGYQQDVNLLQLFSDVAVYNNMIISPEQAEMVVDIACRLFIDNEEDLPNNMFVILKKPEKEKEKNGTLFVKRFIICVNQAESFYDEYNEGLLKPLNVREVGITTNSLGFDDITYDVIDDFGCNIDQFELIFVKRFGFMLIEKY